MEVLPGNCINIILATDIHLGAHEKDGERGDDSYTTFEEILQIAKRKGVDFILLGGDLFDLNKPSMNSYHRCMSLLRKYCMGDKAIEIEFLSEAEEVFSHCSVKTVNYEDPNLNISIPVFSIHGNHDDPSGFGRLSSMDILSDSGLLNYFGKITDLTEITVKPLLFRKGTTFLAIYGLSYVKDDRLHRLFRSGKVNFERPSIRGVPEGSWFNILVLHQNRVIRENDTKSIPENFLPDFIHLVFWGHEHECRLQPEWNEEREFFVTQPGSPVVTALCEAEAVPKKIGLLRVCNGEMKLEPIPLETVRPFVYEHILLSDWDIADGKSRSRMSEKVQQQVCRYVKNNMMVKVSQLLTDHSKQPKIPLIRLKIDFEHDDEMFNEIRLGQTFTGKVVNPKDMFVLKRIQGLRGSRKDKKLVPVAEIENNEDIHLDTGELVRIYFEKQPNRQMKVLSEFGMNEAVLNVVLKEEKDSIAAIINHQINKTIEAMKSKRELCQTSEDMKSFLQDFRELRMKKEETDASKDEIQKVFDSRVQPLFQSGVTTTSVHDMTLDDEFGAVSYVGAETSRRGRGRGRGSRGGATAARGSTKGRGRATKADEVSDSDEEEPLTVTKSVKRRATESTRGRGRSGPSGSILNFVSINDNSEDVHCSSYFEKSSRSSNQPKKKARIEYGDDD